MNRFTEIISVIKKCQEQIRELAGDRLCSRLEISKEIMFPCRQEEKWKKKLPFYNECIQYDDAFRMSTA